MTEEQAAKSAREVQVRVEPVPVFVDVERWLGAHAWRLAPLGPHALRAEARMPARDAARLSAQLRGLGIDGSKLVVQTDPPLGRALVRSARLLEARARRATTPGFSNKTARAAGEGRFSLTPEALAVAMAEGARGRTVVDACCGSGGNADAFARAGCQVTAVDVDPERLAEAAHNARLYGVAERVHFVRGDALSVLLGLRADILFVDPPWGGDYDKRCTQRTDFPLLDRLLSTLDASAFDELWLKLPASFDTRSVPGAQARAWFGEGEGDRRRIKFVELRLALRRATALDT